MLQKVTKSGIIGGLILFIWSMLVWTVLPWQKHQFKGFMNEKSVSSVIKENAPSSGIYVLPDLRGCFDQDGLDKAKERMKKGPFMMATISLEGKSPDMIGAMIESLIGRIIAAFFIAWVIYYAKLKQNKVIKFILSLSIAIALSIALPYVIWMGCPMLFGFLTLLEAAIGWFLAGLAMAKILVTHHG